MSILAYVSALLHLMLSGHRFGQPQGGQTPTPTPSPQPAAEAPAPPPPSPRTEGLGQVGLVLESALGGGAAQSGAQGNTGAAPLPKAAQKGLGTAQAHVGNAHAQAVLAALLAKVAAQEAAEIDPTSQPAWSMDEPEAWRLAELRVDAHKREDLLRRISAAATPTDETAEAEPQGRDPMQALLAQMTGLGAPQGAYSIFSLAAISPEAGRGMGIRLTL